MIPRNTLLFFQLLLIVTSIGFTGFAVAQQNVNLAMKSIIPQPVSVRAMEGYFQLSNKTTLIVGEELAAIGGYLQDQLKTMTSLQIAIGSKSGSNANVIRLSLANVDTLKGDEKYVLEIDEQTAHVTSHTAEGVFRGVQTLLQLLPAKDTKKSYQIPTGVIYDYPTYAYRGAMLDVSRHFFVVDDVKRFIDLIAMYKINQLHLHLTDDQGWRIEIEGWPRLTEHGGSTAVDGGAGGFYTKEDYQDIVEYARERFITIVPEIDMPGHTNAALASYPELNCDGQAPELYTGTKVGFSSFCIDKELTYEFVNDVISQLAEITPGPYIHVGGDESHSTEEDDYVKFVNRVQEIVQKHGKTMIGWDEVAHADLDSSAVVQYWAKADNATLAVEKGMQVIMSPSSKVYLDMKYDSTTVLGQDWAGLIGVRDAYDWFPSRLVPGVDKQDILGVEAPLWTETISTMEDIEYMVFPRILGVAEIGWTPESQLNWQEYITRLQEHGPRLSALGVKYYAANEVWGIDD